MSDDKTPQLASLLPGTTIVTNTSPHDTEPGKPTKCFTINRAMIPSKAVYFFEKAKEACHWPYLILFYCSIGLTQSQSGWINGLRYAAPTMSAPFLGLFADRRQCHKKLVIFICVISIIINVFQPVVPLVLRPSTVVNITQTGVENTLNTANKVNTTNTQSQLNSTNSPTNSAGTLYILLFVVALLGSSFDGSTMTFADYGAIRRITDKGTSIGDQRRMGELGYGFGAMLSSVVLRYVHIPGVSLYAGVFVVYIFVTTALAISYYFLYSSLKPTISESTKKDESPHANSARVRKELVASLKEFKTWFFLVTVVLNGMPLAFTYSFTFVFLVELKTDPMLFGPLDIINGGSGFVVYSLAKHIARGVGGTVNGMALSCFCWFIRLVALSFVQSPWLLFPINLTNGICCGLFTYGYIQFIAENFSPAIQTTMCGITNALYFSFSYLLANVVGGGLYQEWGARKLFRAQGTICAVWSIVILAYGFFYAGKCTKSANKKADKDEMASKSECFLGKEMCLLNVSTI